MSEPGEPDLQESNALAGLRARSHAGTSGVLETEEEEYSDHNSYESLCHELETLLEDQTACDAQLSLFVAASASYRHDTTLRPFPPMFMLNNQDKDVTSLSSALDNLPSLAVLKQKLKLGQMDLDLKLLKLLVWILNGGNSNLKLKTLSDEEKKTISNLRNFDKHPRPHYIFEVRTNGTGRWSETVKDQKTFWAFHGSRLDNFYSILNYGLQQHLNKTGLFGEGIYLCEDLGVCLTYSSQGLGWSCSSLGGNLSCVALTEVRDHDTGVKMFSEDRERGAVAGSVGGRLPDKYILVRNNELLHIRYLLVYKHTSPPPGAGRTPRPGTALAALLADNKVLLFHAAYILMLALIGFSNSTWLQRWLRKLGWKDD